MSRRQEGSGQGEDPTYVTPNDARGEPVYVNPTGDLGAADAENAIYERCAALESGFRKLSLTLGLVYLVNLALIICITAYQPLSQPARQPTKPEESPTFLKPVSQIPRFHPGELGGSEKAWESTRPRPNQPLGDANCSEPQTALNSLTDSGFKIARFTTLGATGRAGPTSLGDHYRGQDHEKLVTLQDGIQLFTVPETGDYTIEVAGAAGGVDSLTVNASARGHGALMEGTFPLTKGEVLKVLVGQQGAVQAAGFSAGGGGGTFVTRLDNTPLIIAGGGGGIEWLDRRYKTCDGTTLTSGQKSYKGALRRAGNADDLVFAGGSNGHGATDGEGKVGGGGGGFLTNGGSGWDFVPWSRTFGGEGGYAFVHGGQGGRGLYYNATGGFGGGGGAYGGGKGSGGGGGYSGGGRGPTGTCECGGGGGSFNAGTDTTGQNGTNAGPGYVIIKLLN